MNAGRLLLSIVLMLGYSPASAADAVFGRWLTDDGAATVRVFPCGNKLCGAIVRVLDPEAPMKDVNNPDWRQRSRPLVGTVVLRDFIRSGAVWKEGRVYDPKTGHSYRSELAMENDGRLKVTGCILFLCRSRLWKRSD